MKLSKGLIAGILEKERKTNPKVHYISDITKANDFAEVVRIFNGRSIMAYGIEEIHEITAESNSLVIGLETLDNGKILAMERALRIAKKREVPVLLDLSGVNLSLYRKNTALSFLNRYTIDLVKGTVEEVQALIRSQKRNRCKKKNIKAEYRDFAIKNKVFLLVESEEYYITDGHNIVSVAIDFTTVFPYARININGKSKKVIPYIYTNKKWHIAKGYIGNKEFNGE